MNWRIFVQHKPQFVDHRGESLKKEWQHAGYKSVKKIRAGQAYELSGNLTENDVRRLAETLLTDPVTQTATLFQADKVKAPKGVRVAQIWPKIGVSDPVAETVRVGARDLDMDGIESVRSGSIFEFWGTAAPKDVESFCESLLMNALVQKVEVL